MCSVDASLLKMIQYYPYAVLVVKNEKILYVNETFTKLLGYQIEDVKGNSIESLILERDHKYYRQNIRDLVTRSDDVFKDHFTLYMKSKSNGDQGVIVSKISAIGRSPEETDGYIIYSRNRDGFTIDKLERANRSLKALTKILEISNDFRSEDDLQDITDIIVHTAGYRMAWIGKIDPNDPSKDIQPMAVSGFSDNYLENITVRWDDSEFGNGPTGKSIKQNKPVVARAIPMESQYAAWKDMALQRGYYSSISVPIKLGEVIYGTINIYASFPDCFRDDEIELLQRIADSIAQNLDRYQLLSKNEELSNLFITSQGLLRERAVELHFLYEILRKLNSGMFTPYEIIDDICENIESGFFNSNIWCSILVNGTLFHPPPENYNAVETREIVVDGIVRASLELYTVTNSEKIYQIIRNKSTFLSNTIEIFATYVKNYDQIEKIREQSEIIDRNKKFEMIGSLTSGFVHDFNNIVTLMIGYSDLITENYKEDRELLGQVQKIREAGFKASKLTDRLRSIGHAKVAQPKIIGVNDLIQKSIKLLDIMIPRQIELEVDLSPQDILIEIDPTDFDQIVFNLIINAKEAITGKGRIIVTSEKAESDVISSLPDPVSSEYVVFSVEDNGKGISDSEMENIFELFFTTKSYGTGLGLATIKSLVEKYSGHIRVSSEFGSFTKFEILFPTIDDREKIMALTSPTEVEERDIQGHIVVIEDESEISTLIEIGLTKRGYGIQSVSNTSDLGEFIRENGSSVDTIIYDLSSNGLDIDNLIKFVHEKYTAIRVLCIAEYNQRHLDLYQNKSINILMKPFTIDELVDTIRSI